MDKEIKELLEQILANQAVLYKMIREIQNPGKGKSTPDSWILDQLREEAKVFR